LNSPFLAPHISCTICSVPYYLWFFRSPKQSRPSLRVCFVSFLPASPTPKRVGRPPDNFFRTVIEFTTLSLCDDAVSFAVTWHSSLPCRCKEVIFFFLFFQLVARRSCSGRRFLPLCALHFFAVFHCPPTLFFPRLRFKGR